jgi:hypothetical protein
MCFSVLRILVEEGEALYFQEAREAMFRLKRKRKRKKASDD